jgi:DNA polymerase
MPQQVMPEATEPLPESAADAPVQEAPTKLGVDLDTPLPVEEQPQEDVPFFRPGGSNAGEAWENMQRLLPTWAPLRQLGTLREKVVLPQGNRQADIVFVGDAPGYHDEKAGLPFQGEAGGKLDGMLKAMGLTREQVYLTHLVKFRPAQPRQTLNTRPPSDKELLFSRPVVDFELRLVQPRVIVALGVIAARGLLQQGNLPLAAYQERVWDYNGIPVIVTHHPSYLLRTSDLGERRRLWEEMLHVMEIAGLPINDKQRGYFLPKA